MVVETQEFIQHLLLEDSFGHGPVFFDAIKPRTVGNIEDDLHVIFVGKFVDHLGSMNGSIIQEESAIIWSELLQLFQEIKEVLALDALLLDIMRNETSLGANGADDSHTGLIFDNLGSSNALMFIGPRMSG